MIVHLPGVSGVLRNTLLAMNAELRIAYSIIPEIRKKSWSTNLGVRSKKENKHVIMYSNIFLPTPV
jgi:hypothetical protein